MFRFYRQAWIVLATASLLACGRSAPAPSAGVEQSVAPRESLSHLVDAYWDESASTSPWISWGSPEARYAQAPTDTLAPQALADALARERRYLAAVLLISRASLEPEAKLTYDIFWHERELAIESFTYPAELMPVNAYDSLPLRFALMAVAAERFALTGQRDLENWQGRAAHYQQWTQQAIANLREGLRRGYTLPLVVVERTLPVLATLGEDSVTNVFYANGEADAERARLATALNATVRTTILPAYRALHEFLQRDYLPRARVTVGLSALPLGPAWYAHLIKRATGTATLPAELHALGLSEIEHGHTRLAPLLAESGFPGNAPALLESLRRDPRRSYRNADELNAAIEVLKNQVTNGAATVVPMAGADFTVQPVEAFRQPIAPLLSYRRARASGRYPAQLDVNLGSLSRMPAVDLAAQFIMQAIPGRHTQLALQQERTDLPKFRRFGGSPAFIAGWSLYAASLGEELGVYHDSETRLGVILAQLSCAADLVIDTGIHAQNWTRQQAIDYVHAQVPLDDVAVANMVDRAIALPGDALSCTVGFLKLQSLRSRTQQALGEHFDPRAFHTEVLRHGALPLDLLEGTIKVWVETPVAAAPKVE